jgi:two-component system sensor histidine kinase YesM
MFNIKNLKLKHQLTFHIAFTILMTIIIQVVYYFYFYNLTHSRAVKYISNIIKQVEEKLDYTVSEMHDAAYSVSYNNNMQKLLTAGSSNERLHFVSAVSDILDSITFSNKNIAYIKIQFQDGKELHSSEGNETIGLYSKVKMLENELNYKDEDFKSPVVSDIVEDAGTHKLYYVYIDRIIQAIPGENEGDRIGTCIIVCKADLLHDIVGDFSFTQNSELLIIDSRNRIIAANDRDEEGKYFNAISVNEGGSTANEMVVLDNCIYKDKSVIVQYINIKKTGWRVVSIIPKTELVSDMKNITTFCIISAALAIIMLIMFKMVISNSIMRPVSNLIDFMNSIGKPNMKKRLNLSYQNEVGILVEHINRMLDNIDAITQKVISTQASLYETELEKRKAELSFLYSQINPHFLYNTLDCMRSIGMEYNIKEIEEITTSLSSIFRYSISSVEEVYIAEEIACIEYYLNIIYIRYPGKFFTIYDIDENIVHKKMIKMVLQPVVENAIYHGLEQKKGKGKLVIKGSTGEGNTITIQVIDDGKGINNEELKKLNLRINDYETHSEVESGSYRNGIGLANINKRIKLVYGPQYGIEVDSIINVGTRVTISLPEIS